MKAQKSATPQNSKTNAAVTGQARITARRSSDSRQFARGWAKAALERGGGRESRTDPSSSFWPLT
jgi:hypothetical protein